MNASTPAHTNRLARETSPYLLQHQYNPVDWYPWGLEAFEAARARNVPIFLSVGYSTCYWCHVMERQCFESADVAAVMNELFVNVKVDREERPDVDALYMTAVQVLTRHGGWPMSVWLTPDLRPFYGGTYFPPADAGGRPGFVTVLRGLHDAYVNRRDEVERSATQLANILQQVAEPPAPVAPLTVDDALVARVVDDGTSDYDPQHGGFGAAPKFPRETLLELLLDHLARNPNADLTAKVMHTLDAMALGGIRDHLGGGFHRYSTDAEWLVPHFEIMLYDNAMLAWCYVEAFRQTENPRYAHVARGIFDFVLREMTGDAGAFYTAIDAEVDAAEGGNYLWTPAETERTLGPDGAALFDATYGLSRGFNFADPHHGNGTPDKNVLHLDAFPDDDLEARLAPMRQKLKAVRDRRKQPLLDTKVITSWNALMIRALAYGGDVLGEPRYLEAAALAANFIMREHRTPTGTLMRASRDGAARYDGFLDDYAYFAQALLALHEADGREGWKDAAATIATDMLLKFGDADPATGATRGFFFTAAGAADLIVRQKVAGDSPLPSGNAVAAMVMQDLGHLAIAQGTVATFAAQLADVGAGMSALVQAAAKLVRQDGAFTVAAGGAPHETDAARPASPERVAADVVSLTTAWRSPTELELAAAIADGFHVNAHNPTAGVVPTQLAVTSDGTRVEAIDYPPGELQTFPFSEEPLRVYAGRFAIVVRFAAAPTGSLRLALRYQACDDNACLAPVSKHVDVNPA